MGHRGQPVGAHVDPAKFAASFGPLRDFDPSVILSFDLTRFLTLSKKALPNPAFSGFGIIASLACVSAFDPIAGA